MQPLSYYCYTVPRYIPEYNMDSLPSGSEDDLPGSRIGNHSQVASLYFEIYFKSWGFGGWEQFKKITFLV